MTIMENKIRKNILNIKNKSTFVKNIFSLEKFIKLQKKDKNNIINNKKIIKELPNLKTLNFSLENQLKYIDIKLKILTPIKSIKYNPKNCPNYIYPFFDNKNANSLAYNSLHDELITIRKKFTLIVKYKELQNIHLTKLKNLVATFKNNNAIKDKFNHNEYVNTSKIIEEDSDEYITRTGVCTVENFDDNNKQYNFKNLENNCKINV